MEIMRRNFDPARQKNIAMRRARRVFSRVPIDQIHEPAIIILFRLGGFSLYQQPWNAFCAGAEISDSGVHLANPCEGL